MSPGFLAYIHSFTISHNHKSHGLKSSDLIGQGKGPLNPIQRLPNVLSKYIRTSKEQCGRAPFF